MSKKWTRRLGAWAIVLILGAAVVYGLGWLAWRAALKVEPDHARAWALIVTALLPLVLWVGWITGHFEARGRLAGIDQTIDKVMGAASRVAGLRTATRAARTVDTTTVLLPMPRTEIVPRKLAGGKVIDL